MMDLAGILRLDIVVPVEVRAPGGCLGASNFHGGKRTELHFPQADCLPHFSRKISHSIRIILSAQNPNLSFAELSFHIPRLNG